MCLFLPPNELRRQYMETGLARCQRKYLRRMRHICKRKPSGGAVEFKSSATETFIQWHRLYVHYVEFTSSFLCVRYVMVQDGECLLRRICMQLESRKHKFIPYQRCTHKIRPSYLCLCVSLDFITVVGKSRS